MTPASDIRRQIASKIAPLYASNPKVAVVLLAGSAARGDSDQFSDMEIGVFWNEPPTDADRQSAINQAGGDLHRLYPYDPAEEIWADDWKIGRNNRNEPFSGISIDMLHLRVETVRQNIDAVMKRFDPDPLKQNLISAIRTGICLHGAQQVARWRQQTDQYPAELMRAVVQKHAQIDHFWRLQMWRERHDPTGVNAKIVATHGAMLNVLLAINGVYSFGFKHRDAIIEQLKIVPANLTARMNACFDTDGINGEQTLRTLVEEVYDLIEKHVPGIDVERLRKIFRYRRPLWDSMPPK